LWQCYDPEDFLDFVESVDSEDYLDLVDSEDYLDLVDSEDYYIDCWSDSDHQENSCST
jgi:hypothetical protein